MVLCGEIKRLQNTKERYLLMRTQKKKQLKHLIGNWTFDRLIAGENEIRPNILHDQAQVGKCRLELISHLLEYLVPNNSLVFLLTFYKYLYLYTTNYLLFLVNLRYMWTSVFKLGQPLRK